jgi:hypothetical protein
LFHNFLTHRTYLAPSSKILKWPTYTNYLLPICG